MASSIPDREREAAAAGRGAVVVPGDPPPWVARAAGWIVLAAFLLTGVAAFVVRLPETVECPCVLVRAEGEDAGRGAPGGTPGVAVELRLDEHDLPRLAPGQRVRLLLDAFPFARYGSIPATLRSVGATPVASPEGSYVVGIAVPTGPTVGTGAGSLPLRVGMKGRARVAVGERSVADMLLSPLR